MTWDDHEVDNNYARLRSETLDPHFARRRAAAYRAYYEHMPLRRRARPTADGVILRSRHDVGALARFHLLDGRQRRTPQACPPPGRGGGHKIDERCRELVEPGRTMLGPSQERWLATGLRDAPGRWHFIAEATLVARAALHSDGRIRVSSDAWDGYPAARERLLRVIADAGLRSCVFLSGDAHATVVSDLKPDFGDRGAPTVAGELCGTSLTSRGRAQERTDAIVRQNPHIHFGDSAHRGYVVLEVTAERCTAAVRALDDPRDRESGIFTQATFAIDAGRPGVRRV
jgi:alkaline phosphatase D